MRTFEMNSKEERLLGRLAHFAEEIGLFPACGCCIAIKVVDSVRLWSFLLCLFLFTLAFAPAPVVAEYPVPFGFGTKTVPVKSSPFSGGREDYGCARGNGFSEFCGYGESIGYGYVDGQICRGGYGFGLGGCASAVQDDANQPGISPGLATALGSGLSGNMTEPESAVAFSELFNNAFSLSGNLIRKLKTVIRCQQGYPADPPEVVYGGIPDGALNFDAASTAPVLMENGACPKEGGIPAYYQISPSDQITWSTDGRKFNPFEATDAGYGTCGMDGNDRIWKPILLPKGLIYHSYLAGRKEPRLASMFTRDDDYGWLWDITLGGRVPLFRYGTENPVEPEGFQIDMEGAALLRLDFERNRELAGTDYRAGLPITYGTRHWQYKFGYYHVSSHLGDNYLLANFRKRVHYVRDELVLGLSFKPVSAVRLYGETGWAFNAGETTSPWEFQVGAEYSPVYDPERRFKGSPFAAVAGHLFQELDFGGYFNSQVGWQWRNASNSRFRLGAEFYCGCDDQFQFHYTYQRKAGLGFWYDF